MEQAKNRPDWHRPEYDAALPAVQLCRDFFGGTRAVKARHTVYLPKATKENPQDYNIRVNLTEVFGAYQRTVQASVGMVFATPPELAKDAHARLTEDWENIDGFGTHGDVFCRRWFQDAIVDGWCAVLVDHPAIPDGAQLTAADEQTLGLRPYWVKITRDRVKSWLVEVPDWTAILAARANGTVVDALRAYVAQAILRQVVIHEPTEVADGAYGVQRVDRYRVLRLDDTAGVTFEVQEASVSATSSETTFRTVDRGVMLGAKKQPLRQIPLAICYAGVPTAPFVCAPPLEALADLNLGHYRVSADRRYLLNICHAPTLLLIGREMELKAEDGAQGSYPPVEIGPNRVIDVPKGGDGKWLAADPRALDASAVEKQDLLRQMGAIGMAFLARETNARAVETALGRKLDDAAENATHATAARALQDAMEQAFVYHAAYYPDVAPCSVKVNTAYAPTQMDPQVLQILWAAVAANRLPLDILLYTIAHGQLPDDLDLDSLDLEDLARKLAAEDTDVTDPGWPGSGGPPPTPEGPPPAGGGGAPPPKKVQVPAHTRSMPTAA
ncbi:MAG: DUF4055 domain-containing protein [Patescibacteria group bacterium]|nr:DUF4055 domain-containing protein [Patescibacteria group bacterium]